MKWIFGILSLGFAAFSFGLRIHPDNAALLFHRENYENYYEVEFFSGKSLAGKLVSETPEAVEISVGAGSAVFQNREIKSRRLLDAVDVKSGKYADIIFQKPHEETPLVSMRYEDSVFFAAEKRIGGFLSRATEKWKKTGASLNPLDALNLDSMVMPSTESISPAHGGLPSSVMPMPGVREAAAENNGEQDYTALLKASLEQLRQSAN